MKLTFGSQTFKPWTFQARTLVGGPPTPAEDTHPNLLAAVHARIDASAALSALVSKRHWTGVADKRPKTPYLAINQIWETAQWTTCTGYIRTTLLQLTIFARTPGETQPVKEAVIGTFNYRKTPIPIATGNCFRCDATVQAMMDDAVPGPDGSPLTMQLIDLLFMQTCELPD